ncbi:hypothetical protein FQN50_001171 [Emmonsiellopsis sp. PD_5]|nr:hypothetical protein FQN50_001171 [Emmonsiellopsis sp. PD_5]
MAFWLPAHFPIEEEHPVVAVHEELVGDVIKIVGTQEWSSVCVVRRGFDNIARNNPVTIVVTTKYPALLEGYERTIRYRCRDYGLEGIEVAFVEVEDFLG